MAAGELVFRVPEEAEGQRLDRFLTPLLQGFTRSAIRRMIVDGRVKVDGLSAAKAGLTLSALSRVAVVLPEPPADSPEPEAMEIDIAFEDEHLVVVRKPAGLVVHPGHGNRTGTLVNGLLARGTALSSLGAPDRPGIVHRLDRNTSGLLVVAKNDEAHRSLAAAFAGRKVHKRYLALVWGRPDPAEGTVERSIGRSRRNRTAMAVSAVRGRHAVTHYSTLKTVPGFALLDIRLETGRTHQIRVHLQSIHHPVVGDDRYGGRQWKGVQDRMKRDALRCFRRHALHAAELGFRHPATGDDLLFRSDLPEEIAELLTILGRYG